MSQLSSTKELGKAPLKSPILPLTSPSSSIEEAAFVLVQFKDAQNVPQPQSEDVVHRDLESMVIAGNVALIENHENHVSSLSAQSEFSTVLTQCCDSENETECLDNKKEVEVELLATHFCGDEEKHAILVPFGRKLSVSDSDTGYEDNGNRFNTNSTAISVKEERKDVSGNPVFRENFFQGVGRVKNLESSQCFVKEPKSTICCNNEMAEECFVKTEPNRGESDRKDMLTIDLPEAAAAIMPNVSFEDVDVEQSENNVLFINQLIEDISESKNSSDVSLTPDATTPFASPESKKCRYEDISFFQENVDTIDSSIVQIPLSSSSPSVLDQSFDCSDDILHFIDRRIARRENEIIVGNVTGRLRCKTRKTRLSKLIVSKINHLNMLIKIEKKKLHSLQK